MKSSDDDIPDEQPKQYTSKEKKEIQYSHPVNHSTGTSLYNILQQDSGPFCFLKGHINSILSSFMSAYQNVLDTAPKWPNAKGSCVYKNYQKETDEEEMQKIQWISQFNWLNMEMV